jgi:putative addiction module CopG family antidote
MTQPISADLKALIDERLATGSYASQEELLRDALRALAEEEEDLRAVKEAVAEMMVGDAGVTLDEAFASVRATAAN